MIRDYDVEINRKLLEKKEVYKVTRVDNLEEYGVDAKEFARVVQRTRGCNCSVVPSRRKDKAATVFVHGNQINFVASLFTEKYNIPRRFVTVLE